MLPGQHFHFGKVINGNAVYKCEICVVDGAEIRISRKRIRNIQRNHKHREEKKKGGKKKEKGTLH
jgi:hypothetical protein